MDLPLTFERNLYRAVIRYKQEHPGVLEAMTEQRKSKCEADQNGGGTVTCMTSQCTQLF